MKLFYILLFFVLSLSGHSSSDRVQSQGVSAFYAALRSDNLQDIDKQITLLDDSKEDERAKKGALLMKRAGLLKNPSEKLKEFKKGKQLLESCIAKNDQPEYHFLRLIIQEHAPQALNYHGDVTNDVKILKTSFPILNNELQREVMDYSKVSTHLKFDE